MSWMSKGKSKRRSVNEHYTGWSRFTKLSWSGYGSKRFGTSSVIVEKTLEKRHWELEDSLVM